MSSIATAAGGVIAPPARRYANVRVLSGTGDPLSGVTEVLVARGRIAAIGQRARRADAPVADWSGHVLMPGLVNADEYLSLKGITERYYSVHRQSPYWQILRAARNALYSLAQGITAIRDVGAIDGINLVLRDAIAAGLTVGPRIYACGRPIAPTFDGPGVEPVGMTTEARGADDIVAQVRELVAAKADFVMIKVHRLDFTAKTCRHFSADEVRAGVRAASAAGLAVGATAPEPYAMREAIEAGVTSFGSGRRISEDPGLPALFAERGVMYTPNLAGWARAPEFSSPETRASHRLGAARCIAAGVRVATGTTYYGDNLVDEILALREAGLDAMASLRAATVNGAALLGKAEDFGTIEVGKRADLLIVEGDPLTDADVLRRPALVVRDGVEHHPAALRQAIGL